MQVRQAKEDDIFDVLVLANQFSREAPDMYRWEKNKFETQIKGAVDRPDHVLLVSEEDDGFISGFILGLVTETYVNTKRVATELAWFVSKDYRGGRQSLKLLNAFEEWGSVVNADYISMSDIKGIKDLSNLYLKKGFEEVETAYVRRIK